MRRSEVMIKLMNHDLAVSMMLTDLFIVNVSA